MAKKGSGRKVTTVRVVKKSPRTGTVSRSQARTAVRTFTNKKTGKS